MALAANAVLAQLDEILGQRSAAGDDFAAKEQFRVRAAAAIERLSPANSPYRSEAQKGLGERPADKGTYRLHNALRALRADYEAGYLRGIEELVHADLFTDFLEMAEHLLDNGYKDAAAVIAGSVLEEHLRKLGEKVSVAVLDAKARPKGVDLLSADLVKADVITAPDRKYIVAWYGVRTKAAHGEGDHVVAEQVRLMVDGVRDFVRRHPA